MEAFIPYIFGPGIIGYGIFQYLNDTEIKNLVHSNAPIRRLWATELQLNPGDIPIRPSMVLENITSQFQNIDPRYTGTLDCGAIYNICSFDNRYIGPVSSERAEFCHSNMMRHASQGHPMYYPPGPAANWPYQSARPFFPVMADKTLGYTQRTMTTQNPWRPDHLWRHKDGRLKEKPFPEMFWCRMDDINTWGPNGHDGVYGERCGRHREGLTQGSTDSGAVCWVCQRDNELLADWAVRQEAMPLCQKCCRKARSLIPRPNRGYRSCNCAGIIASFLCMRCSSEKRNIWISRARSKRDEYFLKTHGIKMENQKEWDLFCPCGVEISKDILDPENSEHYATVTEKDQSAPTLDLLLGGCAGDPRRYTKDRPWRDEMNRPGAAEIPGNNGWCQVCPYCLGLYVPPNRKVNPAGAIMRPNGTWTTGYEDNLPVWHGGNVLKSLSPEALSGGKWPEVLEGEWNGGQ